MEFYSGDEIRAEINGEALACETGIFISESLEVLESQKAQSWENSRMGNQGYNFSIVGLDFGAFTTLKALRDNLVPITFVLRTSDGEIADQGAAWITSISRTVAEGADDRFTADFEALGQVENTTLVNYLLTEAGDFLLLEDGGKIKN